VPVVVRGDDSGRDILQSEGGAGKGAGFSAPGLKIILT
jgi:hypothetical protein